MTCNLRSLSQWGRFQVGKLCDECKMPLDCTTTFASNGAVQLFGGAARGSLKADGDDLTGQGIIVAFFLPSAISLVLSTFLILSRAGSKWKMTKGALKAIMPRQGDRFLIEGDARFPERAYNFLESTLRAISDIQILLALALALSVVVFGICRTLQYHFDIGVNLLLLACASYLQTLGLTRQYWRSWPAGLAALLRLLAVVGIYFCFGWILAIQNASELRSAHRFLPERMPGDDKRDSVIFLKAACFLDPAFQNNTFSSLSNAERTHIGLEENSGLAPEWILGILLAVFTAVAFIVRLVQACRRGTKNLIKVKKSKVRVIYHACIWILSLTVLAYTGSTVTGLRSWVSKSGWLQPGENGNPDDEIRGFGQTVALVLVAAMLIAALENASIIVKKNIKSKMTSKGKGKGKGKAKGKGKGKGKKAKLYV